MRGKTTTKIPCELESAALDEIVVSADGVHYYGANMNLEQILRENSINHLCVGLYMDMDMDAAENRAERAFDANDINMMMHIPFAPLPFTFNFNHMDYTDWHFIIAYPSYYDQMGKIVCKLNGMLMPMEHATMTMPFDKLSIDDNYEWNVLYCDDFYIDNHPDYEITIDMDWENTIINN